MNVTLITPTRDRPEAFKLCEKYMARQNYTGNMQWIVVDDGDVPITPTLGQTYINRPPSTLVCTLPRNLLEAVEHIVPSSEIILFIEDDDWYAPDYVRKMVENVKGHEIAGLGYHRYYNVLMRMWTIFNNMNYAGLCVTAINRSLLGWLKEVCAAAAEKNDAGVDTRLWCAQLWDERFVRFTTRTLNKNMVWNDGQSVGIKAMPGRKGLTGGHGTQQDFFIHHDDGGDLLRVWIGDDAEAYLRFGLPHLPREYKPRPTPTLTVSVVIHNQLEPFRKFLLAIYGLCDLARTEIIVSDNASTDGTPYFRLDNEVPVPGMPVMRWVRYPDKVEAGAAHENARKIARGARFVTVGDDLVPAL